MGSTWLLERGKEQQGSPLILFPPGTHSEETHLSETSTWAHCQEPSVTGLGLSWQIKTQG